MMQSLNKYTLPTALTKTNSSIDAFYDRDNVKAGIVHFGVGNFHRCHQAVYAHKLLAAGHLDWGIVGVSMRSSKIRDLLAPQNFLYTEVTLSKNTEFRVIGSILKILVAPENPAAVINQVADNSIKLVTTTITEKGYCLALGEIDYSHPNVIADTASLENPKTIYGYLAAALIQRSGHGSTPLSILCCDNIQGGGEKLRAGVQFLLQQHTPVHIDWVKENVSFGSSMVDRVSPESSEPLKQLVSSTLGLIDAWPVSAEPFSQWVIEDNFAGVRPDFESVGALFTDDVSLYEQMKLRFLNAGHSMISILGYLDHQPTIHGALEQQGILEFAFKALYENILPVAVIPPNYRGEDYIKDVMQRFQNSALPYTVAQVNTDSSQKIQQRWFQTIDDALAHNSDTALMSFIVAAWVIYIQKSLDADELNDPLRDEFYNAHQQNKNPVKPFLLIAGADRFNFSDSGPFMAAVLDDYRTLKKSQINTALSQFLSHH